MPLGEAVYQNSHHRIFELTTEVAGRPRHYFINDYGERAGIVVAGQSGILLVRQYRLLIDDLSWEIPGGRVDEGETPEMSALRECEEETGFRCRNPKPLILFQPGLDTFHNPTHLFFATEFSEVPLGHSTMPETAGHAWVPLDVCLKMISEREIIDSLSVIGLLTHASNQAAVDK